MKSSAKALIWTAALSLLPFQQGQASLDSKGDTAAVALPPCICWRSPNPRVRPRFALLCVHGLGLYSGSYKDFGMRMAALGAVVYAIDVRGFGSWMQAQGHQDVDFKGCLEDIRRTLGAIHEANPGLPVFLLGESMGGAIALRAASMYPELIDGVVSAVPAGDRFKQKRTDLKVALEILTGPRRKHERIGDQVVKQAATDKDGGLNEKLVQRWEGDPLDRLDLSAKDLVQFQRFMNDNHDAVKQLKVPVLFVQGLDDDLVRPDGTWELVKEVGVKDVTFVSIRARHLMFENSDLEEPQRRRASTQWVLGWILAHSRNHVQEPEAAQAVAPQISQAVAADLTKGMPTVVAFYASWCNQCERLERFMRRAKQVAGQEIRFVTLDVDAQGNQELVKEFRVAALPQMVFLHPDGTVSSTLLGETTAPNIIKEVMKLVGIAKPDSSALPGQR